jgi:altronate dehydratase large subunit
MSELVLGLQCGGSDATSGIVGNVITGMLSDLVIESGGTAILSELAEILGAEHILAKRTVNDQVRQRLLNSVKWCEEYTQSLGIDLIGSNPAPDNIEGGISTIEEKSLGAIKKAGSHPLQEVVDYANRPTQKGLVFMNAPCPAIENMTGMAAAGAHIIWFYTGRGNHSGNPVVPVIKSCGNADTINMMSENIDFDLSNVIAGEIDMPFAADAAIELLFQVASGRLTTAEVLREDELAISRYALSV